MSLSKIEANDILELIRNHLNNFLSKKLNLPLDVITKAQQLDPIEDTQTIFFIQEPWSKNTAKLLLKIRLSVTIDLEIFALTFI
jgi:hypothetical protein